MTRSTIGIPFDLTEHWVGGILYIRNFIMALSLIDETRRPSVVVISDDPTTMKCLYSQATFPRSIIRRSQIHRRWSFWRHLEPGSKTIDVVLPGTQPALARRAVAWIPDLQEERFPQFFSAAEIEARRERNRSWFRNHHHIMVSSQDVRHDIERYYGPLDNEIHVVPFATFIDRERHQHDIATLKAKYRLPDRYYICSNQFWRHKNHGLVLNALAAAGAERTLPPVVFTGREDDYRDPSYGPSLRALAGRLGVAEKVRFLGFLPRAEQTGLLANAIAVLQPSLCEGWSTVIEDAKALGKFVMASDIAVHREQIGQNVEFFDPGAPDRLAELLLKYRASDPPMAAFDYGAEQRRYSDRLLTLITAADRDFRARGVAPIRYTPADREEG